MTGGVKTCFTENSVDNCAMISSPGAGLLASVNYTDQLVFSIGRAAWCLVPGAETSSSRETQSVTSLLSWPHSIHRLLEKITDHWTMEMFWCQRCSCSPEGDGNSGGLKLYLSSIAIAAKNMFSCPLLLSAWNGLRSGRRRRIHCLSFCFSPD